MVSLKKIPAFKLNLNLLNLHENVTFQLQQDTKMFGKIHTPRVTSLSAVVMVINVQIRCQESSLSYKTNC